MQTSPSVLSKNQRSQVRALWRKKGRETAEQFLVESPKAIAEFLEEGWPLITLYRSPQGPMADHPKAVEIPPRELAELSTQESPSGRLGRLWPQIPHADARGLGLGFGPGARPWKCRHPSASWRIGLASITWRFPRARRRYSIPKSSRGPWAPFRRVPLVYGTPEELLARFHAEGRSVYVADLGGEAPAALPRKAPAALVLGQ